MHLPKKIADLGYKIPENAFDDLLFEPLPNSETFGDKLLVMLLVPHNETKSGLLLAKENEERPSMGVCISGHWKGSVFWLKRFKLVELHHPSGNTIYEIDIKDCLGVARD